jgi:hypothetical protein
VPTTSQQLEAFLLSGTLPAPQTLQNSKLAPYAYTTLPQQHPLRPTLQPDMMQWSIHHLQTKAALKPLFKVWHEAGLDFLLFKGFYLAEFVYDQACQRPYNDVDILIHEHDVVAFSECAQKLGWLETWRSGTASDERPEDYHVHEVLHLEHPTFPIRLDIHKYIVHQVSRRHVLQDRLTRAAWANAQQLTWENMSLRALSPVDAILFGLVSGRTWSGDNWTLKSHDYLDMKMLAQKFPLSEADLHRRAKELHCTKTLSLFLQRCNPFKNMLNLKTPTFRQRLLWESAISLERLPPRLERSIIWVSECLEDATQTLPGVVQALRFYLQGRSVEASTKTLPRWKRQRLERGLRGWLFFLPETHPLYKLARKIMFL